MKVLMCNSFYYLRGGAERCFFDLSSLLETHGHEVVPFSMQDERNFVSEYSDYFISPVDFPSRLAKGSSLGEKLDVFERVIYSREAAQRIGQLIEDTQPDIAHVHGIAHETSPSILPVLKGAGIPVVQTLHDFKLLCPNTNFLSHGEVCEACKRVRYYNVVLKRCKKGSLPASLLAGVEMYIHKYSGVYEKNVDAFIAPSLFLQNKVVEYGIKNRIVNIPNFINLELFEPDYAPEDYFVYYGRLTEIKGVRTLLAAMRDVKRSHLYLAGRGELEDELQAYARDNDLTNVTFLGHLAAEELRPLVQKARFSVVPSDCYENYSMSVIESLACGTPVIGSNLGGTTEQIQHGWNGLLFEAGNAAELAQRMHYLLDNPALAVEMGRNGRQRTEEVNGAERHYRDTLALYESLISSS